MLLEKVNNSDIRVVYYPLLAQLVFLRVSANVIIFFDRNFYLKIIVTDHFSQPFLLRLIKAKRNYQIIHSIFYIDNNLLPFEG